jgi:hypothetical protein
VSALSEWAGKVAAAAARIDSELAITVAREQAKDFLAIERHVTPKRTGRLADSEAIDALTGGGTHAMAVVSPHTIYAHFRENGGTITRKLPPPHVLGNPTVGFFGHSVSQAGSHYVERAQGLAAGPLLGAAEAAIAEFFDF